MDLDFTSDKSKLIVIGNGFDLDLGLPTSYKSFFENDYQIGCGGFPFMKGQEGLSSLGKYVLKSMLISNWYDLEDILAEYGSGEYFIDSVESVHRDYDELLKSLSLYLKEIDYNSIRPSSVAARIIQTVNENLIFPVIYSFNYTNIVNACHALRQGPLTQKYVHGSLEEDNIILGVGDYANLQSELGFMYKTFNPNYKSTDLLRDLENCSEAYIFGLSLSRVDYPYFEDFFRNIVSRKISKNKKYIRIFTYDDNSRMQILSNLREMNKGMIKLNAYADFDVIRTKDNVDEEKVISALKKLASHSWQIDV